MKTQGFLTLVLAYVTDIFVKPGVSLKVNRLDLILDSLLYYLARFVPNILNLVKKQSDKCYLIKVFRKDNRKSIVSYLVLKINTLKAISFSGYHCAHTNDILNTFYDYNTAFLLIWIKKPAHSQQKHIWTFVGKRWQLAQLLQKFFGYDESPIYLVESELQGFLKIFNNAITTANFLALVLGHVSHPQSGQIFWFKWPLKLKIGKKIARESDF